jgi:hypothetical protein
MPSAALSVSPVGVHSVHGRTEPGHSQESRSFLVSTECHGRRWTTITAAGRAGVWLQGTLSRGLLCRQAPSSSAAAGKKAAPSR